VNKTPTDIPLDAPDQLLLYPQIQDHENSWGGVERLEHGGTRSQDALVVRDFSRNASSDS
jgi:hypothetical protein